MSDVTDREDVGLSIKRVIINIHCSKDGASCYIIDNVVSLVRCMSPINNSIIAKQLVDIEEGDIFVYPGDKQFSKVPLLTIRTVSSVTVENQTMVIRLD